MVEQEAVNFEVASSSLAGGAKDECITPLMHSFFHTSITMLENAALEGGNCEKPTRLLRRISSVL